MSTQRRSHRLQRAMNNAGRAQVREGDSRGNEDGQTALLAPPFAIAFDRFLTQPDSAPVVLSRLLRLYVAAANP